jgi:hypothetical protein
MWQTGQMKPVNLQPTLVLGVTYVTGRGKRGESWTWILPLKSTVTPFDFGDVFVEQKVKNHSPSGE